MAFLTPAPILHSSKRSTTLNRCQFRQTLRASVTPTPLFDRVLVKVDEKPKESSGGLILTADTGEKPKIGTVVATGPGRFSSQGIKEPIEVAVGDKIMWKDEFGVETCTGENARVERIMMP